jgi:pyruvate/2-oxoglutarate dehydrogenase complex dihydrolipoamide acyltransferase (E2) component
MAKEHPTIHGSVRGEDRLFVAGDEEALAGVLSAEDVKRLTEDGVISGFEAPTAKAEAGEPKGETGPSATDAARALAEEHGIDLASVKATGANSNITKADVEAAIASKSE